ncbi:MAG: hypothetical protein SPL42_00135 [Bacteroidales bacterium]|nr:hypothetical protein [Bacteroidales bacterium]MDY6346827.1 hypothetical protein [Bacteroidales bacterium]
MKKTAILCFLTVFSTLFYSCNHNDNKEIVDAVAHQLETYPQSTLQDVYKSFYQEHFGPEHMIADTASARQYLLREMAENNCLSDTYYEKTGSSGKYVRVFLSAVKDSLITADQLFGAFVRSSKAQPGPESPWSERWTGISTAMEKSGLMTEDFKNDKPVLEEAARNNQAVHHSRRYNENYHPHYRIVERDIFERELKPFLEKKH